MEYLDDDALNIYTDGSCLPRPRRGGMGVRFVFTGADGKEQIEDHCLPGRKGSTNNQMELEACIRALDIGLGRRTTFDLSRYRKAVLFTDSSYVEGNLNNALFNWPASSWTGKDGKPIQNGELWIELAKRITGSPIPVRIKWIPGKSSHHAKAVDKLAKQSAREAVDTSFTPVRVRRKKSPNPVDPGSVGMDGQEIRVYISEDKLLRPQRYYRYRYSVVSEDSPYFELVDFIHSHHMLSAGHTYDVRFNDDRKNPWIVEVLGEVKPEE
jgi:ribonuclease HI